MAFNCYIPTKPFGSLRMPFPCFLTRAVLLLQSTCRISLPAVSLPKIQFVGNSDKLPQMIVERANAEKEHMGLVAIGAVRDNRC